MRVGEGARAGGNPNTGWQTTMNDPHVTKLYYKIEHSTSVDYSAAETLDRSERDFDVRVKDEKVCVTMKRHYATEQEARDGVKDYINAWELEALLTHGPGRAARAPSRWTRKGELINIGLLGSFSSQQTPPSKRSRRFLIS